ncbi:MAG: hypothetical protein AAGK97_02045 [Bacteroidota bacterium]
MKRLAYTLGLIFFCISLTQAQFISVQDGDFNDCATWGLAAGCTLPGPNDDIIISTGTTVTLTDGDPSTPASDPFTTNGTITINGLLIFDAGTPSNGLILNNNASVHVYGEFFMDTIACEGCIVTNGPNDPGANTAECADGTILTGGLSDCHDGGSDVELKVEF